MSHSLRRVLVLAIFAMLLAISVAPIASADAVTGERMPYSNPTVRAKALEAVAAPQAGTMARVYVKTTGNDTTGDGSEAAPFATIQKGLDSVAVGGTVYVYPGSYNETAADRVIFDGNTYTFGLFLATNGVTLQGVKSDGTPITNYSDVATTITTNATNNFGYSGIWVEADSVTIAGLGIDKNLPEDNKTVEVVGENFTLKASQIKVPDGWGSVYINDWRYNSTTNTSYVTKYAIEGNLFVGGNSVDVASGAGVTGLAADRKIINNKFTGDASVNWAVVSFNGQVPSIGWYLYPVGGATIAGNDFSGSTIYIRSRGTVAPDFDWAAYWTGNAFDKATMASTDGTPASPRAYDYTSGSYFINNVKRIGSVIQADIDIAQAGDTVLVRAGTYNEALVINKAINLYGAGKDVLAKNRAGAQSVIQHTTGTVTPLDIQADNVKVNGFKFALTGSSPQWAITAINGGGGDGFDNLSILNNEFVGNPGIALVPGGMYLWGTKGALIEGNYFNDLGQHAVFLSGGSLNATYRNNDSYNCYNSNLSAHDATHTNLLVENNRAIQDDMILFKVAGATIRNNSLTAGATASSRIWFGGGSSNILIENNTITNVRGAPIIAYDGGWGHGPNGNFTVKGNTITTGVNLLSGNNSFIDLRDVNGNNLVQGNTINITPSAFPSGVTAVYGIRLRGAGLANATIVDNTLNGGNVDVANGTDDSAGIKLDNTLPASAVVSITGNTLHGFVDAVQSGALAAGATVTAHENDLSSNIHGMINGAGAPINAELNWWGSACGPTASYVSGPVDYTPWWATPTGSLVLDGTQTAITAGMTTAEQNAVINCAAPGSTITYAVGAYPGGIVVTNNGATINLGGATIGAGSPAFTINADDVSILGPGILNGNGTDPGILVNSGADNFILDGVEIKNWADGVQVAGSHASLKLVNNWLHDNGTGFRFDAATALSGVVTINGNLFKTNTVAGIQNDSTGLIPAEYNAWGTLAPPAPMPNVDAVPYTFVELFTDAGDAPINVVEGDVFPVQVKVDAAGMYAIQYKLTYDPTLLVFQSISAGAFAPDCVTNTATAGVITAHCYRLAPAGDAGATGMLVNTINFLVDPDATRDGQDSWTTHLDLKHNDGLYAAARDGIKAWVNNAGFGAASVPGRDITDTQDGEIVIAGLANYTGYIDLQGRTNDSGALLNVYATGTATTVLADGTSASSGAYATAHKSGQRLYVGQTYYFQVDRALYLPTTATTATSWADFKKLENRPLHTLGTVILLGGDATNDNIIDVYDAGAVGGAYGDTGVTCGAGACDDVTGDGRVDILDLTLMGGNYNQNHSPWNE